MLNRVIKYIKRSRTFTDLEVLVDRCFLSQRPEKLRSNKIKNAFRCLIIPFSFATFYVKKLFFMPKMPFKTNGILEYSFYKEYAKYKFLVLLFIIGLSIFFIFSVNIPGFKGKGYIARITIDSFISDYEDGYGGIKFYEKVIREAIENKDIKGVIVYINSGGGEVTAGEILYNNLLKLAIAKPTFCDIGSTGASGAYMAALACKKIYAKHTSSLGSIGVRLDTFEIDNLAKKAGVNLNVMTSGTLKAAGDPWKKMNKDELAYFNKMLTTVHLFFINLVAKERNLSVDLVTKISDGSVIFGDEAKSLGLIDEIGDQSDILEQMKKDYNLSTDIKIKDLGLEKENDKCLSLRKLIGVFSSSLVQSAKDMVLNSKNKIFY